ncbi:MAG TPA: pitrilysin family protein [Kofleriaceae bacterium]|nr:pitrilysin family protein [Kofleriaceae bacterium]
MRRFLVLALAACSGAPRTTVPVPGAPAPRARATMPPAATATRVRELAGITEYRLSNGLTVLLFPDPSQSKVTVNITYLVGSRVEGYGETGMAHLLEHMTFKGTPRHRNIMKLVSEKGGDVNGSTWTDRTNYFETLPATDDNLDWMIDLEADRMVSCPIAADDLATEFSVVRNEFEQDENDPVRVLDGRLMSAAYTWHNYGKDTIGSRSDIERVPADRLRAFYQRYYQPDDAVLVVAGRFEPEHALGTITRTFGAIPRPSRTLDATYTVEPVQDGEREVTLRRNGKVHVVGVLYHTVAGSSPDYAAADAALDLLTREPSGVLYKKLVTTHLASRVWAYGYQFKEPSVAILMAQVPDPKNVAAVKKIITDTMESLGDAPIDPKAVERWRNGALKQFDLRFADIQDSAIALSEYAALGDWRTAFAWRDQIAKVTPDDVRRVARAYFVRDNRTLGAFVPTPDAKRAPETITPDVEQIADAAPEPPPVAGEPFDATIDSVEAHVTRTTIGGLRAALLPKKSRGGKVTVELRLHYGDASSLKGKQIIGSFVPEMLTRGTTSHDLQALREREDALEADISIYGGASGLTVHVEAFRDRLGPALDLAIEELTQPSFPSQELEVLRAERLARAAEQADDPAQRSWIELNRRLRPWPKDDPRYVLTIDERIAALKAVTIGDVRAFYRDFLGAEHGEVAIVGDFDPAAVQDQLKKLGSWKAKRPYARLDDQRFDAPGGEATIDTPDKEMAELRMQTLIAMKDDDADYPAWLMLGEVFGGSTGSRIWMRLREHEGLSYGAWGWTSAGALDPVGTIGASAIVAPQNLAKARASMEDELRALAARPFTQDELDHARDGWLAQFAVTLASDTALADELADGLYLGRTLAWRRDLEAKVKALSPADLTAVAAKRVRPDALIVVQAGAMAKTKQPSQP